MADQKISDLTAITTFNDTDLFVIAVPSSGNTRKITAASVKALIGGEWWTTVRKSADESVTSSTVLQNDDELFFTTVSQGIYEVEGVLIYNSPAGGGTPDFKIAFGEDATARGQINTIGVNAADAASGATLLSNQTAAASHGTNAGLRAVTYNGWIVGNGGTFRLLWSQNTSNGNATIVRTGSVMRYRLID